jgi:hypothetical protein
MFGQFAQQHPFGNLTPSPFGGFAASSSQQPLQQIVQSLLIVPQQLQHLLQLAQIQQQQVQYLLQTIPQQLLQLHQQVGHQSAFQPFGAHQAWGAPQIPPGISQPFGAQAGYLM